MDRCARSASAIEVRPCYRFDNLNDYYDTSLKKGLRQFEDLALEVARRFELLALEEGAVLMGLSRWKTV